MSNYFSRFPIIQYDGKIVRDITRRSKIKTELLNDPFIFLPYTVREGEKPEDIAFYYYGSVSDTWIVLLSNNITDPYSQWPLSEEDFNSFFSSKYQTISGEIGTGVVDWGQNTTINDNILYYYSETENQRVLKVTPATFVEENLSPVTWNPVRIYDYEKQINNNKREINLIDKLYRNQVIKEFRESMAS